MWKVEKYLTVLFYKINFVEKRICLHKFSFKQVARNVFTSCEQRD